MLLLLYGTGLRISEALNLDMADVDLEEALLHIRETKFYKTRLVPTGRSDAGVARVCVAASQALADPAPTGHSC